MTLVELLEDVKRRFTPLLVTEKATLDSLLRQALGAYQSRAGYIQRVVLQKEAGASLPYPADYLALVNVLDKRGGVVFCEDYGSEITLDLTGCETYPLTLSYFVNLRECPVDDWVVPPTIIPLIQDYLEVLIAIKNSARHRRVNISGKLDTSDIPDEATLNQRKKEIEEEMSAHRAVIATGFTIAGV